MKFFPENGRLTAFELIRFNEYWHKRFKFFEYLCYNRQAIEKYKAENRNREKEAKQLMKARDSISSQLDKIRKNYYLSIKNWRRAEHELNLWYGMVFGCKSNFDKAIDAYFSARRNAVQPCGRKQIAVFEKAGLEKFTESRRTNLGVPNMCYDNAFYLRKGKERQYMGYLVIAGNIFQHSWLVDKGVVIEHSPLTEKKAVYYGIPAAGKKFPRQLCEAVSLKEEAA